MAQHPWFIYDIQEQKADHLIRLQEKKIYPYPYEEFKAELSKNSQASLARDYKSASDLGSMVIFVRDNMERKLVSYIMSIDTITVQ
jgi:hypothetical protein